MDLFDAAKKKSPSGPGEGTRENEVQAFEGTVEKIVFAGHDGEFTVARLDAGDPSGPLTIVGALPGLPTGARLRVRGVFEVNPRFGKQLKVQGYTEIAPETLEGIRRYLGSGLIKGIGKEFAGRIVDKFGMRTLEILDQEPYRIGEVPGIGRSRAQAIRGAWAQQKGVREVMVFLQGHGVSPAFAARIYKRYEGAAIARVRENPYRLAFDVWGIGFLSADKLAMALGVQRESDVRIDAGIRHVLDEAGGQGHVFLPRDRLQDDAASRLQVDPALINPAIERQAALGTIVIENTAEYGDICFDKLLYQAEVTVAQELLRLRDEDVYRALSGNVLGAIDAYEKAAGIALASAQRSAIENALQEKLVVVTGGPGVGKTTIVRGIVQIAQAAGLKIALAAPTGRAAKRMSEATGQAASTLHRLLEWRPAEGGFARNAGHPIDADLLVVDEASMLDVRLAADLLLAVAPGTRLVLVGDVDQLPSVGPGCILNDAISSRAITTVRLTEIFRQAAQSLIVTNAHRINAGQMPDLGVAPKEGKDTRDFFFLENDDAAKAALVVRDLVAKRLPKRYGLDPFDIQVLAPMHRGDLGAGNLNHLLQEALSAGGAEVKRGQRTYRVGDRVMQIRNNYDKDVFNGDVGRVVGAADDVVSVTFEDRQVTYESDELDELVLAYAATVHKSQGSEYPAVVIPIHTQHFVMLQKNLVYTAVTRGKSLVVLVGSKKALSMALGNGGLRPRHTRLANRLAEADA